MADLACGPFRPGEAPIVPGLARSRACRTRSMRTGGGMGPDDRAITHILHKCASGAFLQAASDRRDRYASVTELAAAQYRLARLKPPSKMATGMTFFATRSKEPAGTSRFTHSNAQRTQRTNGNSARPFGLSSDIHKPVLDPASICRRSISSIPTDAWTDENLAIGCRALSLAVILKDLLSRRPTVSPCWPCAKQRALTAREACAKSSRWHRGSLGFDLCSIEISALSAI